MDALELLVAVLQVGRSALGEIAAASHTGALVGLQSKVTRGLLRHGGACLIATHNPETWGYADRVLSMHDGYLQEGAPDAVH